MNSDIEQLHKAIAEDEQRVENGKILLELFQDESFKSVILEGYLTEHVESLLGALTDPSKQGPEKRAAIHREIDSVALFKAWLLKFINDGAAADERLVKLREELERATEEYNAA